MNQGASYLQLLVRRSSWDTLNKHLQIIMTEELCI